MRLTILMSNIAVVPCFQKPWALTSDLDSTGTAAYTSLLENSAAPFLALPFTLPPWAAPVISAPPSAVPLSCRAPSPVLSSCTVLLLILGSHDIALEVGV